MPTSNDIYLTVSVPDSIKPSSGTNTLRLAIATDRNGRRLMTRNILDANSTSVVRRPRRVQWEIWGPAGQSLQSTSGGLGVDFVQNLDTRWERRLTSAGAQTFLDLTPFDPPGTGSYFGTAYFGSSYFGSGVGSGSGGDGPDVVVFAEQNGYLLVFRGPLLTQVDMTTTPWTVVSTRVLDATVRDADRWRGTVKVALGPTAPMVRVLGANPSGVAVENVQSTTPSAGDVFASAVKVGSDRAWYINAEQSAATYNFANYATDDFVNLAAPFQVGDPEVGTTGIGPFGPFTQFGQDNRISTFTDQGKPIPNSRALQTVSSPLNGKQFADPGWYWNYYTAITGLRANSGGTDNPVGVGERMRGFTGHNGLVHALGQVRGELPAVYETEDGDLYGYRCGFGNETGGTGQPLLWPWFYEEDQVCGAVFSSTTGAPSQGVWLIRASGTNLTYELISANGRDDLYGDYVYSTGGGKAYLTTLDDDPNLLKTLRLLRVRTRNMTAGSSFTLAMGFDTNPTNPTGSSYVTIGTVTGNGEQTVLPVSGNSPLSNISGYTLKPRITQAALGAGASSSPPELLGVMDGEYDERPEVVEQVEVSVKMESAGWTDNQIYDLLISLASSASNGPFLIELPDDPPPAVAASSGGGKKWAMLAGISRRQNASSEVEEAVLTWQVWPQAVAL